MVPSEEELYSLLIQKCRDEALHCLGTHYIFRRRTERYKKRIRLVTLLSFITPLLIGAVALTYDFKDYPTVWKIIIGIAGSVGVFQTVLSGFASVNQWENTLSDAYELSAKNKSLSERLERLAQRPPTNYAQLEADFEKLDIELSLIGEEGEKQGITDEERRMGMRYGLFINKRPCGNKECQKVPNTMKPITCDVCGNFHNLEKTSLISLFKYPN